MPTNTWLKIVIRIVLGWKFQLQASKFITKNSTEISKNLSILNDWMVNKEIISDIILYNMIS